MKQDKFFKKATKKLEGPEDRLNREYFRTTIEVLIVIGLFLWLNWRFG